ncbi:MAG: fibro-slime domain-containing protein [Fibromonadaceae bacterium]|jgi:fibro-slime domain-containing protein|nr:fibro-slime domain-containing protein [Fibromonadaceae bacterium]
MLRKLSIFASALAVLFCGVFAQRPVELLDVIIRDFPVTAPGFEEFMGCDAANNPNSTGICFTGNEYHLCDPSVPINDRSRVLHYGEITGANGRRGYINGPDREQGNFDGTVVQNVWANPIKVTTGMVQNELYYDTNCPAEDIQEDPEGLNRPYIVYRYCARPREANGACGSASLLESWFSDGGQAKRINDFIELNRQTDGAYLINYDHNTCTVWNPGLPCDNGFFPLDKYASQGDLTWGRQSLNYWCGPNNENSNAEVCNAWRAAGASAGPGQAFAKHEWAAQVAADQRGVQHKLHNYGFSMAGSGTFKYFAGTNDVFEFIGDDDMWIFIDGQLAADLGGVHLAAPAKIKIDEYARKIGPWANRAGEVWQDNSTHAVHFFYMDRNTDGSNFRVRMSLSGLSGSRYAAPEITKSITTVDDDGSAFTMLYVNTVLESDLSRFLGKDGPGEFGIVVKNVDPGGPVMCGYRIDQISYSGSAGADGQAYRMNGQVICQGKEPRTLASGDSLSFNIPYDLYEGHYPHSNLALSDDIAPIMNDSYRPANIISMAVNSNKLKIPDFKPEIIDDDPRKPDFPSNILFGGGGGSGGGGSGGVIGGGGGTIPGGGKSLIPSLPNSVPGFTPSDKVHSFGSFGSTIPSNKTGELILTAYPSVSDPEWRSIVEGSFFGLPPSKNPDNGLYGIADPTSPNNVNGTVTGGYPFVKNGFAQLGEGSSNGVVQLAPTRCVAEINGEKAQVNCLNFNLVTVQPFQIAVTVYDQLGNFVTQYRETVTEQEFRYVTQGPNYIPGVPQPTPSINCDPPSPSNYGQKNVLTTSGRVNVSVNIYPFSQATGRKFGNGVYIVKIDRVDLPFEGCYSMPTGEGGGAIADMGTYPFVRYHSDLRFGWMRSK